MKWLKSLILLFIYLVYAACILLLILWSVIGFAPKSGDSESWYWVPFVAVMIVFFVSAIFVYKRYKPRLEAAGIKFK